MSHLKYLYCYGPALVYFDILDMLRSMLSNFIYIVRLKACPKRYEHVGHRSKY